MSHLSWDELWDIYEGENLSPLLSLHLQDCDICSGALTKIQNMDHAMRFALVPSNPVSEIRHQQLLQSLADVSMPVGTEAVTGTRRRRSANWRPYAFMGATAVIVVGGWVGFHLQSGVRQSQSASSVAVGHTSSMLPQSTHTDTSSDVSTLSNGGTTMAMSTNSSMQTQDQSSNPSQTTGQGVVAGSSAAKVPLTGSSNTSSALAGLNSTVESSAALQEGTNTSLKTLTNFVDGTIQVRVQNTFGQVIPGVHVALIANQMVLGAGLSGADGQTPVFHVQLPTDPWLSPSFSMGESQGYPPVADATLVAWKDGYQSVVVVATGLFADGSYFAPVIEMQTSGSSTAPNLVYDDQLAGQPDVQMAYITNFVHWIEQSLSTQSSVANRLKSSSTTLSVHVVDAQGLPVTNATVAIVDQEKVVQTAQTDTMGNVSGVNIVGTPLSWLQFPGMAQQVPSAVSIVVTKPGYVPTIDLTHVVVLGSPQTATLALYQAGLSDVPGGTVQNASLISREKTVIPSTVLQTFVRLIEYSVEHP